MIRKNLSIDQGATWYEVICWKAGSPATLVDLTGCTARLQIRVKYASPDPPTLTLTTGGGGITLGDASGTITIEVAATVTAALTPGKYVYDLEIVHSGGIRVTRLCGGTLTVTPEVTR